MKKLIIALVISASLIGCTSTKPKEESNEIHKVVVYNNADYYAVGFYTEEENPDRIVYAVRRSGNVYEILTILNGKTIDRVTVKDTSKTLEATLTDYLNKGE